MEGVDAVGVRDVEPIEVEKLIESYPKPSGVRQCGSQSIEKVGLNMPEKGAYYVYALKDPTDFARKAFLYRKRCWYSSVGSPSDSRQNYQGQTYRRDRQFRTRGSSHRHV
jgi:hypothetical protein